MHARFDVLDSIRIISTIELKRIGASGILNPRLDCSGDAVLMPAVKDARLEVSLRLECGTELIGESRSQRLNLGEYGNQIYFEIVTSQRLLRHITDGLPSSQPIVQMTARLQGVGWYTLKTDADRPGDIRTGSDPQPGQYKEFELKNESSSLSIERSEWYRNVVAQTRGEQYRFLEIALPRSDSALAREWGEAVQHLQSAEQSYTAGDDAGVFARLRNALDALPGAKQEICEGIRDDRKRKALDELLKQVGEYLHLGRHVSNSGPESGRVPVDHVDAGFAIDLVRTVLSHLSLMLSTEENRAIS